MPKKTRSDEEVSAAFDAKVLRGPGCWKWTGQVLSSGYGYMSVDGATHGAHRYSFARANGPIPRGREWAVDHICRNRLCVRPDHLRLVTRRVNILIGVGPTAMNSLKTECPKGHPYDAENTATHNGKRHCKTCSRDRSREFCRKKFGYTKPDFHLRTHCPKGHPYSPENTYHHPKGCRLCRACRTEAKRVVNARLKAQRAEARGESV